ncbi:MAG: TRAP transporter small permease [Syntrophobacterales bacterium]|nr:TRAP transporter small permease [Syntrophobacterales bacterium]
MVHFEKLINILAYRFNWIAVFAVVVMMILTSADVVLRLFRHPIPGAYEIVGLLGAVVIAFSLAYTSAERGHIAVEFLVRKFPRKAQSFIAIANNLIGAALFGLIAWQSILYASDLKQSGEVSMTIQMPVYPFVYGIAFGCGLLCLLLLTESFKSLKGTGGK